MRSVWILELQASTTGSDCTKCQANGTTRTLQRIETGPELHLMILIDASCTRSTDSAMQIAPSIITTFARKPPVAYMFLACILSKLNEMEMKLHRF